MLSGHGDGMPIWLQSGAVRATGVQARKAIVLRAMIETNRAELWAVSVAIDGFATFGVLACPCVTFWMTFSCDSKRVWSGDCAGMVGF